MPTIDAVVFDIGNVLIEWNPERFYDATIGPERRRALFQAVPLGALNESVDAGAPFAETILGAADRYPDWADEIRMWHDNWIDMASPRIDRSVRLMRALRRRGVPVFALTNFGNETFARACAEYDFFNEFDRAYVSARLGLMKPDPAIYAHVEADSGIDPGALLFTDDKADNTAAAAARGWATHLFDGPDGLAARLVHEGLLTPEDTQ